MTQFEYVSVAIALVYSFAVARIISALPAVLAEHRRDWIHALWAMILLMAVASTWWGIWRLRDVEWTALRFVWALSVPALIHVRVGLLVSDQPTAVTSWREHYARIRVPFFGLGIGIMANLVVLPWIMGVLPWFAMHPSVLGSLILIAMYGIAIVFERRAVQATVALVNFAMILVLLSR